MKSGQIALVALLILATVAGCKKQPSANRLRKQMPATYPAGAASTSAQSGAAEWPGFRGPGALGVAPEPARPPEKIDLGHDVAWKTELSLEGNSSPIVAEGEVFLTGENQQIAGFDAATGKQLWSTAVPAPAGEAVEPFSDTGLAAPTPCTDGQRVYAFFGTGLLACVDVQGKLLWQKRLVDKVESSYGLSASPIPYKNCVIQVVDLAGKEDAKSFIIALDARGGNPVWRVARPVGGSWASPALVRTEKGDVLIVSGNPLTIGYDPESGKELWRVEGLTGDVAASPAAGDGMAFVCSDPNGGPLLAIRINAREGKSPGKILWRTQDGLPDVPSPVCVEGKLYLMSDSGKLQCLQAPLGKKLWEKDLGERFWASPVYAASRLYLVSKEGKLLILSAGSGETLSAAHLGEGVVATPAIVGKSLYLRSDKHLWKLESSSR